MPGEGAIVPTISDSISDFSYNKKSFNPILYGLFLHSSLH